MFEMLRRNTLKIKVDFNSFSNSITTDNLHLWLEGLLMSLWTSCPYQTQYNNYNTLVEKIERTVVCIYYLWQNTHDLKWRFC